MDDLLLALSLTDTRFHEAVTTLIEELQRQHLRDNMAWYQSVLVHPSNKVPLDMLAFDSSSSVSSSSSLKPRDLDGPEATSEHFGGEQTVASQDLGFGSRAYVVTPTPGVYAEEAAQYMSFTLGSGSPVYPDNVCMVEAVSGAATLLAEVNLSPVPIYLPMASSSMSTDGAESDGPDLNFVVADNCLLNDGLDDPQTFF